MHTLRHLRALACLMLAWFALSIGVATASPFVSPQPVQLVCSGAGEVKLRVLTEDGTQEQRSQMLDCPLCVHLGGAAPPPESLRLLPAPRLMTHVLQPVAEAHIAVRTAAPLSARGPPLSS